VKPPIRFRALHEGDHADFTRTTGYTPGPSFGGIVAFHDHVVMGAVGLDGWTNTAVMAHWWIRHPRCIVPLWNEVTEYLALHGKRKVLGSVPASNTRCLRMIFQRLGWQEIVHIKDGWDTGIDLIIAEYTIHARQQRAA
jgi:hypothetical protein